MPEQATHTPGPWYITDPNRDADDIGIGDDEYVIADVQTDGYPLDTSEANARLIAAAPDLLAACKAIIGRDNPAAGEPGHIDLAAGWAMAREAIAKAERKETPCPSG